MPLTLMRKAYTQRILPILTYDSGTWHLAKDLVRKLRRIQKDIEREMLSVSWSFKYLEQTKVEGNAVTINKK